MNPILRRTVTALVTAGLVVCALLWVPKAFLVPVIIAVIGLVHAEFSQMVAKKHDILVWPGVITGIALLTSVVYGQRWNLGFSLPVALFFMLALATLFGPSRRPLAALGTTVLGVVYIPVLLMAFVMIPVCHDMKTLLYVIAIVKISDMGGFAFGLSAKRIFGDTHRMCPSISPNKSWEGMFGSVFGSCLVSCLFMPMTGYGWAKALGFGLVAAVVGTLGDLVESRFKRECEVKDSATFMPAGMGGFLDMFDSLIFVPAILFPFL